MKQSSNGFVADGHERAVEAWRPHIEQEVRARYAKELADADFLERQRLLRRIRREVAAALDEAAPPGALY